MLFDVCPDCGKVQQFTGNLRYCCSRCDRITNHIILRDDVRLSGLRKEDFDLENHFASGL